MDKKEKEPAGITNINIYDGDYNHALNSNVGNMGGKQIAGPSKDEPKKIDLGKMDNWTNYNWRSNCLCFC